MTYLEKDATLTLKVPQPSIARLKLDKYYYLVIYILKYCNACYKYFAASKKYAAAMSSKLFLAFNKIWIEFLVFRIIKNYDYDLLILIVSLNTSDSTFG